ncbi:MAG: hypothetical protein WBV21_14120, partial [Desulfobacterales bacterium]
PYQCAELPIACLNRIFEGSASGRFPGGILETNRGTGRNQPDFDSGGNCDWSQLSADGGT